MQSLNGTVISNKMLKTVVVAVDYVVRHPKYHKIIKRTTKIHAHNENKDLKVGDKVQLVKSKPYSKTVHFTVVEIKSQKSKVKNSSKKPK
ncbi:MAG: 30S ribosomal protein S17 [Patescibacteria group bacterium]|nr:30S ribosomal protein S17 [Patescibacteria group bacterium]MCL5432470.1 30S ribosomal protein S17 [Patescibacteria group bacterium]